VIALWVEKEAEESYIMKLMWLVDATNGGIQKASPLLSSPDSSNTFSLATLSGRHRSAGKNTGEDSPERMEGAHTGCKYSRKRVHVDLLFAHRR
jgi:hypothetical protein